MPDPKPGAPLPTSAVLMAANKHIAIKCKTMNDKFIKCKREDANPEHCLREGDAVTACTIDLLKEINSSAPQEFKAFYECLDYYSNNFVNCRKEQKQFEEKCPPTYDTLTFN